MRKHVYFLLALALSFVSSGRAVSDGYTRLVTPRCGEYSVVLSDGTRVWLNVESELAYPARFSPGRREVYLRGEAYFKIAPDASRPFVIHSGGVDVISPGAECNVRDRPREGLAVTPVAGTVLARDTTGRAICHPRVGQQATWRDGAFAVAGVETGLYTAWKEGYFEYRDAPLERVLEDLSRWYGFTYTFACPAACRHVVNVRFPRFVDLDRALELVSPGKAFSLVREERRVTVVARA
jgi:ferric-dicitrate binding protein FerR (iron transport regulator)